MIFLFHKPSSSINRYDHDFFFFISRVLVLTGMTMIFLFHQPSSSINRYDHAFFFHKPSLRTILPYFETVSLIQTNFPFLNYKKCFQKLIMNH